RSGAAQRRLGLCGSTGRITASLEGHPRRAGAGPIRYCGLFAVCVGRRWCRRRSSSGCRCSARTPDTQHHPPYNGEGGPGDTQGIGPVQPIRRPLPGR
ncbi:unnamed protein product, partial [Symbiodinium necroappetens]